uniref:HTH psq-type domain-containing protein n=1 Tax=Macaca fascicularis TaxID=9541 RepID=Q95KH2_MACFA|nr:hypothetical protein [Macaca fascicularis]
MRPIGSTTSDASRKQRKVMTLQEKVDLLNTYYRLRSAAVVAHHFKINEPSARMIVKEKEIHEAVTAAMPAGMKTLYFLQTTFLSCIENAAFMWVQDCYEKGIPIQLI